VKDILFLSFLLYMIICNTKFDRPRHKFDQIGIFCFTFCFKDLVPHLGCHESDI